MRIARSVVLSTSPGRVVMVSAALLRTDRGPPAARFACGATAAESPADSFTASGAEELALEPPLPFSAAAGAFIAPTSIESDEDVEYVPRFAMTRIAARPATRPTPPMAKSCWRTLRNDTRHARFFG